MSTANLGSILQGLIQTCRDGEEGFRNAAVDVEKRELKELFTELAIQRQQFARELETFASELLDSSHGAGRISTLLHRSWINLKSAVLMGRELAILTECARSEDVALGQYRAAMDAPDLPGDIRETIEKQALEIQAACDRVRDLHDRFATGGAG